MLQITYIIVLKMKIQPSVPFKVQFIHKTTLNFISKANFCIDTFKLQKLLLFLFPQYQHYRNQDFSGNGKKQTMNRPQYQRIYDFVIGGPLLFVTHTST
jgi:hypothetical protein